MADKNIGMLKKKPPMAIPLVIVTFCRKDVEPGDPIHERTQRKPFKNKYTIQSAIRKAVSRVQLTARGYSILTYDLLHVSIDKLCNSHR